jgi:hypothetical protein
MIESNSRLFPRARAGTLAAAVSCTVAGVVFVWSWVMGLPLVGLPDLLLTLGILTLNLLLYRRLRGGERAADLAAGFALFTAMATAGTLLSYLAFRAGAPLADARLAAWDQALFGFYWPDWAAWVEARPGLRDTLNLAYTSMSMQIAAALVLLPLAGMRARADEFLVVMGLCLAVTVVVSAMLPAEGAGVFFRAETYARYLEAQRALREGTLGVLDLNNLQGIVTFPSYHTATGVALIYAARGTPLAFLAWVLNGLMILSTPTEGWHYLVDVAAGVLVALGAIFVARRLFR